MGIAIIFGLLFNEHISILTYKKIYNLSHDILEFFDLDKVIFVFEVEMKVLFIQDVDLIPEDEELGLEVFVGLALFLDHSLVSFEGFSGILDLLFGPENFGSLEFKRYCLVFLLLE
jgi:hypothetical protein